MKALRLTYCLVFLVLLVSRPLTTGAAASCTSCPEGQTPSIDASLISSETAIVATIAEVLKAPAASSTSSHRYYKASANRILKGCSLARFQQVYIKTTGATASCGGLLLQQGVPYILFGEVTREAVVGAAGNATATHPVLTIDPCQAQTLLQGIGRQTRINLQNRPDPVCADFAAAAEITTTPNTYLFNCRSCPSGYYDGCNTCSCNSEGRSSCTAAACGTFGMPSCRNIGGVTVQVPPPTTGTSGSINCVTCPHGYYDGCNTCGCNGVTPTFCSRRSCTTFGTASCTGSSAGNPGTNLRPSPVPPPAPLLNQWPAAPAPRPNPTVVAARPVSRPVPQPVPAAPQPRPIPAVPQPRPIPAPWPRPVAAARPRPTTAPVGRPSPTLAAVPRAAPSTTTPPVVVRPLFNAIINCRTCPNGFYDGCNSCTCKMNTTGSWHAVCTDRTCVQYGTAACSNFARPSNDPPKPQVQQRAPTNIPPPVVAPLRPVTNPSATTTTAKVINCQTCPKGYNDGCNSCGCSSFGDTTFCSSRACPAGTKLTPKCN